MEEEIDLREYLNVLFRYWKWIAGVTLIAVVVAVIISLLLPRKYTAMASVIITAPRYRLNFDPRFETIDFKQAYGAYLELAKSDDVIIALIEQLGDKLPLEQQRVSSVRGMLSAQPGQDRSFISLRATSNESHKAASIANAWADVLIRYANALYGQHEQDLTFFQSELQKADQNLDLAERNLIDFQGRSRITVLQKQIVARTAAIAEYLTVLETGRASTVNERVKADTRALKNYLAARNNLRLVLQDARALRARLHVDTKDDFPLASTLAALLLELEGANVGGASDSLQLQIPMADMAGVSEDRAALVAYLDALIGSLEGKDLELIQAIDEISQQLLKLEETRLPVETSALGDDRVALTTQQAVQELQIWQQELQQEQVELDRLKIQRDLARDTYKSLVHKVEESKLKAAGQEEEVRLASLAAVPERPSAPQKKMIVAAAGALSLFTSALGVFLWEWWRGDGEMRDKDGDNC